MVQRILIVEDDPSLLEMYQMLLEGEGYQVSLSQTIFEDVTEIERLHPDLVLLDVQVSYAADGLSMLQQLRSSLRTSSLPIILCTIAADPKVHEKVESFREQGIPVIYKPFDLYELLRVIREALGTGGEKEASTQDRAEK